jgi:hypothetical protein
MSARRLTLLLLSPLCALALAAPAEAQVLAGPSPSAVRGLLDGRAYEMVSPAQKDGAQVETVRNEGGLIQAAEDGDAITYLATAPIVPDPPANPTATQVLSERTSTGWSSQDISTPGETAIRVGQGLSYRAFSSDLSTAFVEPRNDVVALAPDVPSELSIETYSYDLRSGIYTPLVTDAPPPRFSYAGFSEISFEGASEDGKSGIFSSYLALTPNAIDAEGIGINLYEWTHGALKLVSVLPNGSAAVGQAYLGAQYAHLVRNAVSTDGSRVIWLGEGEESGLYLRDTLAESTVQMDAAQGGPDPSGGGIYQAASQDDSHVFFTDDRELTSDAHTGEAPQGGVRPGNDLYEFNTPTGALTDLTPDSADPNGAQVEVVIGASDDGSDLYFSARGALAPGGTAGRENIYEAHFDGSSWAISHIATLSDEDRLSPNNGLQYVSARVSPNGAFLAFMSKEPLTGYDNRDASSGLRDEEVYLYDAATERLVCASCNPSGERPHGEIIRPGATIDPAGIWQGASVAALVPGWTPSTLGVPYYQPRYLSDSGRLFFDSVDPLVSHDINGQADVYEYEPASVGGCAVETGCVALVSSGLGSGESSFMDASASGDDVFLLTGDRLVSQDADTSLDLYDAHVCSAASPCLQTPAVAPPACDTGDACKAAPSPQPGVFGDPASATFTGAGNVTTTPTARKVTPKKAKKVTPKKAKKVKKAKRKSKRGHDTKARRAAHRHAGSGAKTVHTGVGR